MWNSGRHGLIGVEMDSLGAGDLHHRSVQTGVRDQPHHALCYQRRPAGQQEEKHTLLFLHHKLRLHDFLHKLNFNH